MHLIRKTISIACSCLLLIPISCLGQSSNENSDVKKIEELIAKFAEVEFSDGYYISQELSEFKGVATPHLIEGLRSKDPRVRKGCTAALSYTVGGYQDYSGRHYVADAAEPLLAAASVEKDEQVLWYMAQAIECIRPSANKAIPVLIELSKRGGDQLKDQVIEAIESYGAEAAPARTRLHEIYRETTGDTLRTAIHFAIQKIGVNEDDVELIANSEIEGSRDIATAINVVLDFPNEAIEFLSNHPRAMENQEIFFRRKLFEIFEKPKERTKKLRKFLEKRDDLPTILRVRIGSPEQKAALEKKLAMLEDDPHQQSFVKACIRALKKKQEPPVVKISKDSPGEFRPASAHPGTDKRRMTKSLGHGDGYTEVLITGSLILADGTPAKNPKFYAANDRMLLGKKQKIETPLFKYDSSTGRFAYFTNIFAAYQMGKGQQPGPYQTGVATTLVEADNAESLIVEFFDEMPEVEIKLPLKPSDK